MKRILVTGGGGFIGTYTCRELRERGYEPVVLDRARQRGTYDVVLGDVRDREAVEAAVYSCDGVIHLAGQLGTQETIDRPHGAAQTNILGTLNVLDAAKTANRPVVNISVGNFWMNNPYSITKHCAERFCQMYRKEHGLEVSVVRALNAYGPGQKAAPVRKIIPTFVNRCLDGRPIEVYGDGEQIMDMVHVADVARVLVTALEQGPFDHVIEAGTGRPTTVNQIAQAVIDAVGQGAVTHTAMRPGEEPGSTVLASTDTLPLTIDPASFITLEDGLVDTVAYYRQNVPVAA